MNDKKNYSVCFSGHRPEKLGIDEDRIREMLKNAVAEAVDDGYTVFITGMARGVDIWAADIVLEMKRLYKNIELICALPMPGFERRRTAEEQRRYRQIISEADKVITVSQHYSRHSFQLRNEYMVDNSSRLIAVYNGSAGGTRNTIRYAVRKGKKVLNLLDHAIF